MIKPDGRPLPRIAAASTASGNALLAGTHPVVKSGTRILVATLGHITPTRRSRGAGLLIVFLTAGPIAALAAGQWTADAADAGTSASQQGGATGAAVLTALMTLAVMALTLLTVHRLIKRFLDSRRMAAWEADWRATGPRWTGRR